MQSTLRMRKARLDFHKPWICPCYILKTFLLVLSPLVSVPTAAVVILNLDRWGYVTHR